MQRREFIGLVGGAAAWPVVVQAQQPGRIPVIGFLWHAANQAEEGLFFDWTREGFTQLGYIPGKNIIFEDRFAAEIPERFDSFAAELVRMNVDAIVCAGPPASYAAKKATSKIPIVIMVADPVGLGFAASLARPGGNITGASNLALDLEQKRLQMFNEALPNVSRLALISNPNQKYFMERNLQNYSTKGRELGIEIELFEIRDKAELEVAFKNISKSRCDGILVGRAGIFDGALKQNIAEQALAVRLPTISDVAIFPEAGCLMSYSSLWRQAFSLLAGCVKRILEGEKPADIPVQQPTKFELVLNMYTAKALGLTISPQFLARVDRVIE
jgi:putative ABC transport system substrate-binding protein